MALGGEELHEAGREGARLVKQWLESTTRFRITHEIYNIPDLDEPPTQLRVPQLNGTFERFDLFGHLLDEAGTPGNDIYIECKRYTAASNQADLYHEYLAVCYSAFSCLWSQLQAPPSIEFMWATTHPFSQTKFLNLTSADEIKTACASPSHQSRLGGEDFDQNRADVLAERLWLCIVNKRVEEMMMGRELLGVVASYVIRATG